MVEINILAKNSDGFLIYPEPFYIKKINIAKYPTDKNSTNKAYLIPLCDLIATPTKKYVPYNIVCPKCKKDMQQILKGNTVSYRCNCGGKVGIEWILEEEREKQAVRFNRHPNQEIRAVQYRLPEMQEGYAANP